MIRILIAHSSRLVCDSLRTALDKEEGVYIVGCATTAEDLYFLLPHGNVVLMGTELGKKSAFEILGDIRITKPEAKVLVMGLDSNPDLIVQYIESGAAGYVLQDESVNEMMEKLIAVNQEKALISPSVAAALMDRLSQLANLEAPLAFIKARHDLYSELTSREQEVLKLISQEMTNQEIADALFIECGTVKNHVHNILKKLEVSNRYEAASIYQLSQDRMLEPAL